MLAHELYLLVTCLSALGTAIRVDWNTNTGPIIPPTPTTTRRPQPPFREPAPVWEDQSNDIPNPNLYVYVLPPPSRPRPATNNYLTFDRRPATPDYNIYNKNGQQQANIGQVIGPNQASTYLQQQPNGYSRFVPALSTKYIPNVGNKYAAVVYKNSKYNHAGYDNNGQYFGDKLQGKYNAKTKKYKAYELKSKYVPVNYLPLFELVPPGEQQYVPEFDSQQLVREQQLPQLQAAQPFGKTAANTSVMPTPAAMPAERLTSEAAATAATAAAATASSSSTTTTTTAANTSTAKAPTHWKNAFTTKSNEFSHKSQFEKKSSWLSTVSANALNAAT